MAAGKDGATRAFRRKRVEWPRRRISSVRLTMHADHKEQGQGIRIGIKFYRTHFGSDYRKFGWGGRIRTFTVLINSEVSYQLDHAPVEDNKRVI